MASLTASLSTVAYRSLQLKQKTNERSTKVSVCCCVIPIVCSYVCRNCLFPPPMDESVVDSAIDSVVDGRSQMTESFPSLGQLQGDQV